MHRRLLLFALAFVFLLCAAGPTWAAAPENGVRRANWTRQQEETELSLFPAWELRLLASPQRYVRVYIWGNPMFKLGFALVAFALVLRLITPHHRRLR